MSYACRKLDDSEFKNPFERGCFIRVRDESDKRLGRARSRSRSRSAHVSSYTAHMHVARRSLRCLTCRGRSDSYSRSPSRYAGYALYVMQLL